METKVKSNGKTTKKDLQDIKSKDGVTLVHVVKPNGKEKPEVKKVDLPSKPQQEVKPVEEIKTEKPVQETPKPVLTLEQKIEKVENLKTLIEKREKLEESRKKLNAFVVGSNQFSENIVLTDENGNTFKTSNSEVFAKVVEVMNNTLVDKIKDVESQIEF